MHTEEQFQEMLAMKKQGKSYRDIALHFGYSTFGISLIFKNRGLDGGWCRYCGVEFHGKFRKNICENCAKKNVSQWDKCKCGNNKTKLANKCLNCANILGRRKRRIDVVFLKKAIVRKIPLAHFAKFVGVTPHAVYNMAANVENLKFKKFSPKSSPNYEESKTILLSLQKETKE